MKYLILLLALPLSAFGQTQFVNTSCATAGFLSKTYPSDSKSSVTQTGCSGSFKLYYYYHANAYQSSTTLLSYSTSATTTFKAFGPFNSKDDACAANLGSLTPVASTSTAATSQNVTHAMDDDRIYLLEITVNSCTTSLSLSLTTGNTILLNKFSDEWERSTCEECVAGFRPTAGTYILSAWVKDAGASATTTNYVKPSIVVSSSTMTTATLQPTGEIIDGWQRIEGPFTMVGPDGFQISLVCASGTTDCFFDDIRVFPVDGSMVTYVYDPVTLRLMAELDERNYAKLYEYDEDGKLIRVKKETEKGIMTIQENRENNSKE